MFQYISVSVQNHSSMPKHHKRLSKMCNQQPKEDGVTHQLEDCINVYKGKKLRTDEFLHNLLFNINYIQYKILELQFVLNE